MSTDFLGERVSFGRKQQKLTQEQLAERVGSTQGAIAKIEAGQRVPSKPLLSAISRELGVNEEWLRTGEGQAYVDIPFDPDVESFAEQLLEIELDSAGIEPEQETRTKLRGLLVAAIKKGCESIRKELQAQADPTPSQARDVVKGNFNASSGASVTFTGGYFEGAKVEGNIHINAPVRPKVINNPPEGSVSEAQAKYLQDLIVRIGELLSERDGGNQYGSAMNSFKRRFSVTSYKNLPSSRMDEALDYLKKRTKAIESDLRRRGASPVDRNELIKRIQTYCKRELGWTDPIRREYMLKRYKIASLTDFSMAQLEDFYTYVSTKARSQKD